MSCSTATRRLTVSIDTECDTKWVENVQLAALIVLPPVELGCEDDRVLDGHDTLESRVSSFRRNPSRTVDRPGQVVLAILLGRQHLDQLHALVDQPVHVLTAYLAWHAIPNTPG